MTSNHRAFVHRRTATPTGTLGVSENVYGAHLLPQCLIAHVGHIRSGQNSDSFQSELLTYMRPPNKCRWQSFSVPHRDSAVALVVSPMPLLGGSVNTKNFPKSHSSSVLFAEMRRHFTRLRDIAKSDSQRAKSLAAQCLKLLLNARVHYDPKPPLGVVSAISHTLNTLENAPFVTIMEKTKRKAM